MDTRTTPIRDPHATQYVLLLSLAQSASGANLTAANHVFLVHPMLAGTQEKAVSYEMQAIGRARRWGQLRDTVHLWRFITVETVEEELTKKHQAQLWEREQQACASAQAKSGTGAAAAAAAASAV